jgi:hypothetical protein
MTQPGRRRRIVRRINQNLEVDPATLTPELMDYIDRLHRDLLGCEPHLSDDELAYINYEVSRVDMYLAHDPRDTSWRPVIERLLRDAREDTIILPYNLETVHDYPWPRVQYVGEAN